MFDNSANQTQNFPCFGEKTIDIPVVDKYISGQFDENELTLKAVNWISENADFYCVADDGKAINLVRSFAREDASAEFVIGYFVPNESPETVQERKRALARFAEEFLNNPFLYENHIHTVNGKAKTTSKDILAYFVNYKGISVPIGVFKDYYDLDVSKVIYEFMLRKLRCYRDTLEQELSYCNANPGQKAKSKSRFGVRFAFTSLFLLLLLAFLWRFLFGAVEWRRLLPVFKSGADFFQGIGLLVEGSYGVPAGSFLCVLLFAISVVWLWNAVPFCASFCKGLGTFKNRNFADKANLEQIDTASCCKKLKKLLASMLKNIDEAQDVITVNKDNLVNLNFSLSSEASFLPLSELFLTGMQQPVPSDEESAVPKSKADPLPSGRKLCILFLLLILSFYFGNSVKTDAVFVTEGHRTLQAISSFFVEQRVTAGFRYKTTEPKHVYTSAGENGLALCTVKETDSLEILEADSEQAYTYKVRFKAEYGYISGWIKQASLATVSPLDTPSVKAVKPTRAEASSTDAGSPWNLTDGYRFTVWSEGVDGRGDWEHVDYYYDEPIEITGFRFAIGNGINNTYYKNRGRATGYDLDLYVGDERVESVKAFVNDTRDFQLIHLNKPVRADRISFVLTQFIPGEKWEDTFISNIDVYAIVPEEN